MRTRQCLTTHYTLRPLQWSAVLPRSGILYRLMFSYLPCCVCALQVSCVGRVPDSDVTPGTIIEAHTDCGYWVGRIKSITLPADSKTADAADTSAEPQFTVKVLEAEDVLTVAAKQLRYALVWGKDGSWERMPVPATPADKRKAAASKSKSTVKRGDADAAAATPSQPASTAAAGTAGTDTAAGPSAQPAASQPQAEAAANGNTVKSPFDNLIKGVRTSDTQEVRRSNMCYAWHILRVCACPCRALLPS